MARLGWAVAWVMLGLAAGPALAQDAQEGQRLASRWCANCHQVGPGVPKTATDAVPSFQSIAAMPSTTMLSIRVFLRNNHAVMPDFKLTDAQIDDVGAYILGLRGR